MKKLFFIVPFIIGTLFINSYCSRLDQKEKKAQLKKVAEYKIKVAEPSGLAITKDRKYLWTVSDQNSSAYMITLNGKIIKSLKINALDLEAVTIINDTTIAVVSEISGEIIFVGYSGKELKRIKTSFSNKKNNGLEGITYDRKSKHFFVVKEKNPAVLTELDSKFNEISRKELKFANDYSGLELSAEANELWILSDENKSLYRCTLEGRVIESFRTSITQAEGVAIDSEANKIYVISDAEEKLYIFEKK